MTDSFIGRTEELNILDNYSNSLKSELVAVYGRRRVGKTFLIRHYFNDTFDFTFSGLYETSAKIQRDQFQKTINRLSGVKTKTPSDWFGILDNLKDYLLSLNKDKVIVFIDELPWLDTAKSNFLTAFSTFFNGWNSGKTLLKLFVCGSATTWMVNKFIGDKGGLYGRISRSVYLAPFSLLETEKFLNNIKNMNYGRKQILDVYMIFGGIPYYLDMLDKSLPLSVNVDNLLFKETAPLKNEYNFLFRSLFNDSNNYKKIIEALSTRLSGLTRDEISAITKLSGGELSTMLSNLSSCDFIRCYSNLGKIEKNKIYQLTDMFSLFYLRFIQNNDGADSNFWTNSYGTGLINSWCGYAFEQVCLHHIKQIKYKLGISGILTQHYAFSSKPFSDKDGNYWPGAQIDLIIDRKDNVINLCEMKYSIDEYVITKDYENIIKTRNKTYKLVSKTKKDLRNTFITTFGVKKNIHSYIADNEITLNDLFIC